MYVYSLSLYLSYVTIWNAVIMFICSWLCSLKDFLKQNILK